MKASDYIELLNARAYQAGRGDAVRTFCWALAIGSAVALGDLLFVLGLAPDLVQGASVFSVFAKLSVTLAIVVPASIYLTKLAQPDGRPGMSLWLLAAPFAAVIGLAATTFAITPSLHWKGTLAGDQWLECLLSIPLAAIVPFAVIIWAVRRTVSHHDWLTGALAGLIGGTFSGVGYALHCADGSLASLAVPFVGAIAICGIAGATLGPRLLRR
jgi:hypothetical protein